MSFPRISDVSKHLARKRKGPAKLQLKSAPATASESQEATLVAERGFAVVRENTKSPAKSDGQ